MHAVADVDDFGANRVAFTNLVAAHPEVFPIGQLRVRTVPMRVDRRALGIDQVADERHLLEPALLAGRLEPELGELPGDVIGRALVAVAASKATFHRVAGER